MCRDCKPQTPWDPAEPCEACEDRLTPVDVGPAPKQPDIDRHGWVEDRSPCTGICPLCASGVAS